MESDLRAAGYSEYHRSPQRRGSGHVPSSRYRGPEPDPSEHHAFCSHSCGRGTKRYSALGRSTLPVSAVRLVDVFGQRRKRKLRVRSSRSTASDLLRIDVSGELYLGEEYQQCARERRAHRLCWRRTLRRRNCKPLQSPVRPRQRGGNAPAAFSVHRHVPNALRTRAALVGWRQNPEHRVLGLESQHGDAATNGPMADTYDKSDLRSIEQQSEQPTLFGRGHCETRLHRQSRPRESVSAELL